MDLLKTCTTNVHVVEDIYQIQYSVYHLSDASPWNGEKWAKMQKTLAELRTNNVLCSSAAHELWIFGETEDNLKNLIENILLGLKIYGEGVLQEIAFEQTAFRKPVSDALIEAIELGVAFKLAKSPFMIHVGLQTWLFAGDLDHHDQDRNGVLIKLRTNIMPSGTLYLIYETTKNNVMSLRPHTNQVESELILAPRGKAARKISPTPKNIIADSTWKAYVVQTLQAEGIEISDDAEWIHVKLLDDKNGTCVVWPSHLCFPRQGLENHDIDAMDKVHDWRYWFYRETGEYFKNPITIAEDWFKLAAEREQSVQEGVTTEAHTDNFDDQSASATNPSGLTMDGNAMTSPPFTQRSFDHQVAMSGIYPTPPDGLAVGLANTQLNSDTSAALILPDQGMANGERSSSGDEPYFPGNELGSSTSQPGYHLDGDDLFGDVGEMEFAENEVGDADFSFFDEPDEEPDSIHIPGVDALEVRGIDEIDDDIDIHQPSHNMSSMQMESEDHMSPDDNSAKVENASSPAFEMVKNYSETRTSVEPGSADVQPANGQSKREAPLSPFGIRERLLPPPIPASKAQQEPENTHIQRRDSTFGPLKFREGFNLGSKYASRDYTLEDLKSNQNSVGPNISLPPKRKKSRPTTRRNDFQTDQASESDNNSSDTDSSRSGADLPMRLPWDTRKRKRRVDQDFIHPLSGPFERMWSESDTDDAVGSPLSSVAMYDLLEACLTPEHEEKISRLGRSSSDAPLYQETITPLSGFRQLKYPATIPSMEEIFLLTKRDLIYIAQIVSEQSVSSIPRDQSFNLESGFSDMESTPATDSIQTMINLALGSVLPNSDVCDLSQIALHREPPSRASTGTANGQLGRPRPPPRADSAMSGPDCFVIRTPYVKVQRGGDDWEMLPTSLDFWEALGLGPGSGPKNVRAFCVFPSNDGLQQLVEQFLDDLGTAYESCGLGSHTNVRSSGESDETKKYEDGIAPVELADDDNLESAMESYCATCVDLGKRLSHIGHQESDCTIVVYILNPFSGVQASQYLCACFWKMFKTYSDGLLKPQRNQTSRDVVLQLLPMDLVSSLDSLALPEAKQLTQLAKEVYDRCPPPSSAADNVSLLPIYAAPLVQLATPAPKRIGFHLVADPPSDLLYEGSILHMSYARSKDEQWLTAVWMDNAGQHLSSTSFCLRGRSFAEVAEDVWDHTLEILAARQVMWRIFVVTNDDLESSILDCWRSLSSRPRAQALCVTMLAIHLEPIIRLVPSPVSVENNVNFNGNGQDTSFLTPVSTPQGANFTSSPDIGGQGNAPPTPAASDTAAAGVETDMDAQLMDLTDETWGMLFSPSISSLASDTGTAKGAIFKRGEVDPTPGKSLPSLSVTLHWTIQIKPSGSTDEGSVKQAEMTLREVLKMFRNLSLLTKARSLDHGETALAPLHVAMAMQSVKGLNGMLSA